MANRAHGVDAGGGGHQAHRQSGPPHHDGKPRPERHRCRERGDRQHGDWSPQSPSGDSGLKADERKPRLADRIHHVEAQPTLEGLLGDDRGREFSQVEEVETQHHSRGNHMGESEVLTGPNRHLSREDQVEGYTAEGPKRQNRAVVREQRRHE